MSDNFYDITRSLISDVIEYGFEASMLDRLRNAIEWYLPDVDKVEQHTALYLESVLKRAISPTNLKKNHSGVPTITISHIEPALRVELDKRIRMNVDLIKLNRDENIEKTLRRFAGWASSVPVGETRAINQTEVKDDITKSVKQLKYEQRRRDIDQGHKMTAAVNEIIALQNNAVAMEWYSNWRQHNYNYRVDHKDRDEKVYAIRGSWAIQQGLINKGAGYTDEITAPGSEVFCRCRGVYKYGLNKLPDSMLTKKGREWLEERRRIRSANS